MKKLLEEMASWPTTVGWDGYLGFCGKEGPCPYKVSKQGESAYCGKYLPGGGGVCDCLE